MHICCFIEGFRIGLGGLWVEDGFDIYFFRSTFCGSLCACFSDLFR